MQEFCWNPYGPGKVKFALQKERKKKRKKKKKKANKKTHAKKKKATAKSFLLNYS